MNEKYVLLPESLINDWLESLKDHRFTPRDHSIALSVEFFTKFVKFEDSLTGAMETILSELNFTAYLVIHPDGDKFVCTAPNPLDARNKVIQRVKEEYGEIWSSADVQVLRITDIPCLVNNHTWMIKRKYEKTYPTP